MRVNEVIAITRTDQEACIHYGSEVIVGSVYELINTKEYKNYRIGDMFVTRIGTTEYLGKTILYVRGVKA